MSALKNRDNERLSQEKANHYKEIDRLEKEQKTNSSNDKKRVLKACGLSGASANSAYDTAIEIANEILKADKPYGAFYFVLAYTMDIANIKQQTEIVETLKRLFNSQELNDLISVDKNYKKLQSKIEKKINISNEANEISGTSNMINWLFGKGREDIEVFDSKRDLSGVCLWLL